MATVDPLAPSSAHDLPPRSPADSDGHRRFWLERAGAPTPADVTLALPDACVDELEDLFARFPGDGGARALQARLADVDGPDALRDAFEGALEANAALAREVRERLARAPGAVLIDRFPAERWSDEGNRAACGLFSGLVGPLMAQDFAGTLLYDVMDKRVGDAGAVRRSITNLDQRFHTDGGWVAAPARYIGLYCIRPAASGGHSLLTSLLAARDALGRAGRADVLETLAAELPWDRQGEHADGEPGWAPNPVFVEDGDGFLARFYESYVRGGYAKRGEAVPADVDAALSTLAAALDAQPRIRFMLEAGQYQYVNNHTLVHAREAFEDDAADGTTGPTGPTRPRAGA